MPPADPSPRSPEDQVLRANAAFYEAFEQRDLDAMSDIWEHSDRVTCVHPGWAILSGWAAVSASWYALFDGPQRLQFIVTEERVQVMGDVAWVTADENLIGDQVSGTVAAVNVYRRIDGRWTMVLHHGSPVAPVAGR